MNGGFPTQQSEREHLFNQISLPSGGFAMVANDQRESLRSMFANQQQRNIQDETLIKFKIAVAENLANHASAILYDRLYGYPALEIAREIAPKCGILVAADQLYQPPGKTVLDTDIDKDLDPKDVLQRGASALKLLIIWKGQENSDRCLYLSSSFMEQCRSIGLLGIVEAIVRKPDHANVSDWDREGELLNAARALGSTNPDLYKAEVPYYGKAKFSEIKESAEAISEAVSCPWVVLSSGVEADIFPDAVEAACRGGASGFLAGRAIWQDTITSSEESYYERIKSVSVPGLTRLIKIVEEHARPWQEAIQLKS
jgi:sulfofructosephosphate aldolase